MKKLFLIFCAVSLTAIASAQITWNVKGGIGLSKVSVSGDSDDGLETHLVGRFGVGLEKPLSNNFSIMPSLEFAVKGYEFSIKEDGYSENEKVNIGYLQLPVLAAYRLNINNDLNLVVKAGPYFAFALFGKEHYNDDEGSESFDIFNDEGATGQRFDAGIDFGLDLEYQRFVFGVEYEHGFVNLIDKSKTDDYGSDFKITNQAFYLTVGYKF